MQITKTPDTYLTQEELNTSLIVEQSDVGGIRNHSPHNEMSTHNENSVLLDTKFLGDRSSTTSCTQRHTDIDLHPIPKVNKNVPSSKAVTNT